MKALAFSGGKDSWACLWLLQAEWPTLTVLWVDTGKNYPEALESIERAKAFVPNFIRIPVDAELQITREGYPSEVIPFDWTPVGQSLSYLKPIRIQSYMQCCYSNLAAPLMEKCRMLGITHLVRGQRNDESHRGVAREGSIVEGIIIEHPIENWSRGEVLTYLRGKMNVPAHFSFGHSSLDCHDCTAFNADTKDLQAWAKVRHPQLADERNRRMTLVRSALRESLEGVM